MTPVSPALIQRAAELIRQARSAVVFTGAGISTPSGIPDFRSAGSGLWTHDDPMEVASLTSFRRTPQKFYNWINPLVRTMSEAKPNPAHLALAQLEKAGLIKAVITQNIDALHRKAGSRTVIEVHGSMDTFTCPACRTAYLSDTFLEVMLSGGIPTCPKCGKVVKPDIVLYEELLPQEAWAAAEFYAQTCDLMLVVGSSLETFPAAGLPYDALQNHARLIINSLSPTTLDAQADIVLRADTLQVLPSIAQALLG
jgi:NAD-dependent deacetylase